MDDTNAMHCRRWWPLRVALVGVSLVLTALLVHDAIQAVRTLKTGYFPGFLFTTYLQSLRRLPRNWEVAAVAALPALSLVCSGVVAVYGLAAKFTRRRRVNYLLVGIGLALIVANLMAFYLIRKAYVAV